MLHSILQINKKYTSNFNIIRVSPKLYIQYGKINKKYTLEYNFTLK